MQYLVFVPVVEVAPSLHRARDPHRAGTIAVQSLTFAAHRLLLTNYYITSSANCYCHPLVLSMSRYSPLLRTPNLLASNFVKSPTLHI